MQRFTLKAAWTSNENLASAIGESGAERFLRVKSGEASPELVTYLHEQEDYNLFAQHMLNGTKLLDSLYKGIESRTDGEKSALKKTAIEKIVASLDTVSFHSPKYAGRFRNGELPNNAYFLSFVRYDSQKDDMKKTLEEKFGGNISAYLNSLKEKD